MPTKNQDRCFIIYSGACTYVKSIDATGKIALTSKRDEAARFTSAEADAIISKHGRFSFSKDLF